MQASMAIKTEVARLESVSDILKHRRIVPTIIDGMAFDVFFKVVFMEQSLYHYGIRRHYSQEPPRGQFYFGKVNVLTVPCAIFVSYNATTFVKKTLHRATRWICESGLLDRHLDQVLLQTWRQIESSSPAVEAIRADDISGLFAVWIMGMGMAAAATFAERLAACQARAGPRSSLRHRRNKLKPGLFDCLHCVGP
ncbi:hypothetical protein V5799_018394 [Amblyomma americanum]|uniref:Uncharacterized protein n=1 Tax=Amblyomma americanum TaxID=6943 RepID=A0AAQ4F076_AMBAM